MEARIDVTDLELANLESSLKTLNIETYRARQIYHWIHRRGVTAFDGMTNLSRQLQNDLASRFKVSTPVITERQTSSDGTIKFALQLTDDHQIESVFIPETPRKTFCLSTQVGCAMQCTFCLTG